MISLKKSFSFIHHSLISLIVIALIAVAACGGDDDDGVTDSTYKPGEINLGDTGPGGGIIFYVADGLEGRPLGFTVEGYNGATGSFASYTAHYLEVAPSDSSSSAKWGGSDTEISGVTTFLLDSDADAYKIGNGRKDTQIIVAHLAANITEKDRAAQLAAGADFGGKNDWFLPSSGELNLLYTSGISGITSGRFLSSSQHNIYYAWNQMFDDGTRNAVFKTFDYAVRAVRAF